MEFKVLDKIRVKTHEGRYWKEREKYITVGKSYVWDGYGWALQM